MAMLNGLGVVITGASSGIGEATAEAFVKEGAHVALIARRKNKLDELKDRLMGMGRGSARAYVANIVEPEEARRSIDDFAQEAGNLTILVNCAGVGVWGPAMEAKLEDWQEMINVNLTGLLNITRVALPHLAHSAAGARGVADIVSISSIAGRKVPGPVGSVYAATKHAVGAFSEGLRQEMAGQHVRVGLVEPGIVATEMTTRGAPYAPDARTPKGLGVLQPSDIASAVLYMVTRPKHAAVNEILVRPTEQVI